MKIRHPWLIALFGLVVAWVVRLWIRTLRYDYRVLGDEDVAPTRPGLAERYIYAFWHENLLLPAYHYACPDVYVLISTHADGQLIAEACRHLGFRLVRGSTTRGGVEAVRQMLRLGNAGHLAITPDGPRGPRRQVQMGLIYLAARTGMAVVVGGMAYDRPWRMRSWDRFALPRPWSRATCVVMPPVRVPADVGKEELEGHRRQVEEALLWATEAAERWAETGQEPEPAGHAPRMSDSGPGTA
jgi:lysophospholipid acyltransferase (LPLAT)-like uncharacterized protein